MHLANSAAVGGGGGGSAVMGTSTIWPINTEINSNSNRESGRMTKQIERHAAKM